MSTLRKESVRDYTLPETKATHQDLVTGSLQRIADATEVMAKRHTELIRERDYLERVAKRRLEQSERQRRSASALRGVITRLKRELDEALDALAKARGEQEQ